MLVVWLLVVCFSPLNGRGMYLFVCCSLFYLFFCVFVSLLLLCLLRVLVAVVSWFLVWYAHRNRRTGVLPRDAQRKHHHRRAFKQTIWDRIARMAYAAERLGFPRHAGVMCQAPVEEGLSLGRSVRRSAQEEEEEEEHEEGISRTRSRRRKKRRRTIKDEQTRKQTQLETYRTQEPTNTP